MTGTTWETRDLQHARQFRIRFFAELSKEKRKPRFVQHQTVESEKRGCPFIPFQLQRTDSPAHCQVQSSPTVQDTSFLSAKKLTPANFVVENRTASTPNPCCKILLQQSWKLASTSTNHPPCSKALVSDSSCSACTKCAAAVFTSYCTTGLQRPPRKVDNLQRCEETPIVPCKLLS